MTITNEPNFKYVYVVINLIIVKMSITFCKIDKKVLISEYFFFYICFKNVYSRNKIFCTFIYNNSQLNFN